MNLGSIQSLLALIAGVSALAHSLYQAYGHGRWMTTIQSQVQQNQDQLFQVAKAMPPTGSNNQGNVS